MILAACAVAAIALVLRVKYARRRNRRAFDTLSAEADLDRAREPYLSEAVREVDAIVPAGTNFDVSCDNDIGRVLLVNPPGR